MTRPERGLAQCTVVGLATRAPRAAALLTELGFNLCDDGLRTIAEACAAHDLPLEATIERLQELGVPEEDVGRLGAPWWAIDDLTGMIVTRQHGYLRATAPVIRTWLETLAARKSNLDPFLPEIRDTFAALADTLMAHLAKEEAILFPAFEQLARAWRDGLPRPPLPFPTVLHPIRVMETEHERVDHAMHRLKDLTRGFAAPPDACATWRLCYAELARFERELCTHMHFENDILFPRALELERRLP